MGGLDIFYIRRDGDSWTKPQNIGYPINSPEDELGIFVSTSGRIAYFSSYKAGEWNIYAINLYKEARPEEVIIVKGSLANNEGEYVADANISIHYNDTGEKQEVKVNQDDGSYAAAVKVNDAKSITIVAEKENATFAISQINLTPLQTIPYEKPSLPVILAKDSLILQAELDETEEIEETADIMAKEEEDSALEKTQKDTLSAQVNFSSSEDEKPSSISNESSLPPLTKDSIVATPIAVSYTHLTLPPSDLV